MGDEETYAVSDLYGEEAAGGGDFLDSTVAGGDFLDSALAGVAEAIETVVQDDDGEEYPIQSILSQRSLTSRGPTREAHASGPPDTEVSAEVILLITSLGSVRRMFFNSLKAQHFLNCKGVIYYLIDINREVSDSAELSDQTLYRQWQSEGILLEDATNASQKVSLVPQVLIDGVPIGDETMLQDLEEDGDLDWLLCRAACPACLNEKDPNSVTCGECGTNFRTLIPEDVVYSGKIQQIFKGQYYGALGAGEIFEHPKFEERMPSAVADLSYRELFGEEPPENGDGEEY